MRKMIFALLAFGFVGVLNANNSFACSCIIPTTNDLETLVEIEYKNSVTVFSGKVIEIIKETNAEYVQVKFLIKKSYKGSVSGEIVIKTGFNDGDCGYQFTKGENYLIYTYGNESNLKTNICTRTELLASNKDIKFLNKIVKERVKSSPK